MRCARCGRPLHRPQVLRYGQTLGPKCAKNAKPQVIERDLFPFDIDVAEQVARVNLALFIALSMVDAKVEIRELFAAARRRAGVWV